MEPEVSALFRLSTDRGKNVAMSGRVARLLDRARFCPSTASRCRTAKTAPP